MARGFRPAPGARAGVVVDVYGLMHDRTRAPPCGPGRTRSPTTACCSSSSRRRRHAAPPGVECPAARHFAYHSVPAARRLFADAGLSAVAVRSYSLYGGSVLLLATRTGTGPEPASRRRGLERRELGRGRPRPGHDGTPRPRHPSATSRGCATGSADATAPGSTGRVRGRSPSSPRRSYLRAPSPRSWTGSRQAGAPDARHHDPRRGAGRAAGRGPQGILLMLPDLLDELRDTWPGLAGRWVVYGAVDRPARELRSRGQKTRAGGSARRAGHPRPGWASWAAISSRRFQGMIRIVRARRVQSFRREDRDVGARRVSPVLVRVAVDDEVDEVRPDPAVVQQGVGLARRAVAGDRRAASSRGDQELQEVALRGLDPLGEARISPTGPRGRRRAPGP